MNKRMIALSCIAWVVGSLASQSQVRAQGQPSPTLDILLFASNVDQPPIETPAPNVLIVTSRSGPVMLRTQVGANGVSSTLDTDRTPTIPGATVRFTVTLLSLTEFTISGVVTFDDARRSTIEFETVANGQFEEVPSVIGGVPFLRGGYIARVTNGTGQFANMEGVGTVNVWLDISRPGLQNAIEATYMLFRLAPTE